MKLKHLLLCCCMVALSQANAQRPFITTWNTANPGVSKNNQIFFYATGNSYTVSWVNTSNPLDSGNAIGINVDTITFATQGIYKVYITPGFGTFTAFRIYGTYDFVSGFSGDYNKLLSIEQWGDISWSSFNYAFALSKNLVVNATDIPNLAGVTDMSNAFEGCSSIVAFPGINNWDVSNVTDMSGLFDDASHFNQPLGNWNVSNVTSMNGTFNYDSAFNQDITNWNVGNVTDMVVMFVNATAFQQPIGSWDVSKVTDMGLMFDGASSFNQPLGNWDVSNVTNMDGMFYKAIAFNQPIGSWNVGNVTNMSGMFQQADSFNQPIGSWNVSNVTNMTSMFAITASFNQPIGNWDVGNVTDMDEMFAEASAFNQPIDNWNVGNVTNMFWMFNSATLFNQPVGKWNVSNVIDMFQMFGNAKAFDQNIGAWNLSSARTVGGVFDSSGMSCGNYSLTLKGWADSAYTPSGLSFGAADITYDSATAKAAHDSLTNIKGWTITGDKIGNCTTSLPVTFISFTASQKGTAALLNWSVGVEENVKEYIVEKSSDAVSFTTIGFVTAKGDALQASYNFTDNNLTAGISYYRIKEADKDGRFLYSSVRKTGFSKFAWKMNGNPVNNSSVDVLLDKQANVTLQVISINGNIIKTISKGNINSGSYHIPLNINNVNTGVYLVRLLVADKVYSTTIVKQ